MMDLFLKKKKIYYFHVYEVWHSLKGGGRVLSSRNTLIYCLGKKIGWKKKERKVYLKGYN